MSYFISINLLTIEIRANLLQTSLMKNVDITYLEYAIFQVDKCVTKQSQCTDYVKLDIFHPWLIAHC